MRKLKLIGALSLMIVMLVGAVFSVLYLTKGDRQAKVVTTNFPAYDICRELLGPDDDNVLMLENASSDMHSYNPTAGDIATISKCELFICIGGESDDKWLSDIVRSANNTNLKVLELIDIENVNRLEENHENILENDHDHSHEDHSHEEHEDHDQEIVYDEHIWLSIKNMIEITNQIEKELINVFPQKQEMIKDNATEYISKLVSLDEEYTNSISNSEQTLIIADRFPFRYLVHDYNIKYYAIFSGCSTESDAKAETIIKLNEKITECQSNYIYILESSNRDIADRCVSKNPNLKVLQINSCQSINMKELSNLSYYNIMLENLKNLEKALHI